MCCVKPTLLVAALLVSADQPSYELPPVNYSRSRPTDRIAALQVEIDAGRATLARDPDHGYLRPLLDRMGVPVSSQVLVFSKTSFQAARISPRAPRAVYFADDLYVGWVQGGDVLEISSVDPDLGAVFYTLSQKPADRPRFIRQTDNCLQCHDSAGLTLGVPGHIVRSVYPGGDGLPRLNLGTFRTTYRSPLEERWGGWYVTGTHGAMRHMGNVTFPDRPDPDLKRFAELGANRVDLSDRFDVEPYLAGTSDIAALMVLEHQAHLHNLLARANHETRIAVLQSADINRALGTPSAPLTDGTRSRIRAHGEALVEGLLFSGEVPLTDRIRGNSTFMADYEKRGPFDSRGRSLRQFDLEKRMFKFPCSPLVYSKAFASLPREARDYVATRMEQILLGRDLSKAFAHLTAADRQATLEILRETLPGLAGGWR